MLVSVSFIWIIILFQVPDLVLQLWYRSTVWCCRPTGPEPSWGRPRAQTNIWPSTGVRQSQDPFQSRPLRSTCTLSHDILHYHTFAYNPHPHIIINDAVMMTTIGQTLDWYVIMLSNQINIAILSHKSIILCVFSRQLIGKHQ